MRQAVRQGDIRWGGLDEGDLGSGVTDRPPWPLVLVQQGDGTDQRQILHVVTPHPRDRVREPELRGEGVHDRQRFEQTLRVAVRLHDRVALAIREETVEGLTLPL